MHAASITRKGARPGGVAPALLSVCTLALFAAPGAEAAVALPDQTQLEQVDFERHVMGLFGRMGCNAGACHGSFQGKGGFRLSLFGYDPEKDYYALTRDVLGRRINPVDPDQSLILLKATGQVEHGGGKRFDRDSWQYRVLREWITGGRRWTKGSGEVKGIAIRPAEHAFDKPGQTVQLRVSARFADGTEQDITPFCDFRTTDDAVAEVSNLGAVNGLRPGDTAIVVSYRGNVLPVRVLVPLEPPPGFRYPTLPQVSYIDRAVFAKLRRLNIVPSDLAGDLEFLRRVTIDTIACLPTPEEVRTFLADKRPDKRAKKIDELLAHPLHAALWATKFSDITGNDTNALENPRQVQAKRSQMWHDWFRKRVQDNVPYDEIVRGVLCATSRDGKTPEEWMKVVKEQDEAALQGFVSTYKDKPTLDLYWRRQQNTTIEQWGEKTAAAFMGVRLECAQCHKHPFDRWTQADYRSYANLFTQVSVGQSVDAKKLIDATNSERRKAQQKDRKRLAVPVREVYVGGNRPALRHPDTGRPLPAKALGGPEIKTERGTDARAALFAWLRAPDNPFFARSFVNRVWGHYFGVGLVHPVDDFSLANPPSNPKLLDALAKDFTDHQYDIRHVERTILNSRTYQLSCVPNATNRLDRTNYSHSLIRPMMAEAVVDVLNSALGTTENFGTEAPAGCRAIEVGASRVQNPSVAYALRVFGRPPRSSACDCDRAMDPALPQTLYRMTDPNLLAKLKAQSGRLQQLLKSGKNNDQVLEELFLATLSRLPTGVEQRVFADEAARRARPVAFEEPAAEKEPAKKPKGKNKSSTEAKRAAEKKAAEAKKAAQRRAAEAKRTVEKAREALFTDVLWALINTREFILNH